MGKEMAPWVPIFIQSCKNNKTESNPFTTFQFATVDKRLKPRVRTVVFRDFLCGEKKNNILTFNTDLRSEKLNDYQSTFEACFYFPVTWEQFRFSGKWFVVGLNQESVNPCFKDSDINWNHEIMRQWNTLSRSSKALYRKPAPGSLLDDSTVKKLDKIQRGVDGAKEDVGLENFAIIGLCIDKVDYLNLKDGLGGVRRVYKRMVSETLTNNENDNDSNDDDDNHINNDDSNDFGEIWEEKEICP